MRVNVAARGPVPESMACIRHSYVVWTSFFASSSTSPTKKVSFRSPWKPLWKTVMSTAGNQHNIIQTKADVYISIPTKTQSGLLSNKSFIKILM